MKNAHPEANARSKAGSVQADLAARVRRQFEDSVQAKQKALEALAHYFGRVQALWKPVIEKIGMQGK